MEKTNIPPKQKIEEALLKKATGYDCDEVVCEYTVDENGEQKLCKKKVTKKHISADIPAAKLILEHFSNNNENVYENMSCEQLALERKKLLSLLKKEGG